MSEQDVHEIQLNGKQLVFMFMAATVVSVVIFLCGVMVGRGVRHPLQTLTLADTQVDSAASLDSPGDPSAPLTDSAPTPSVPLTYAERLDSAGPDRPVKRSAAPVSTPPAAPPVVVNEPEPPSPAPVKAPAAQAPSSQAPLKQAPPPAPVAPAPRAAPQPGNAYVLQIQALPTREGAQALVDRLKSEGFPAFVIENPAVERAKYRVRVGYSTKSEADAAAARLKPKYDPWVIP